MVDEGNLGEEDVVESVVVCGDDSCFRAVGLVWPLEFRYYDAIVQCIVHHRTEQETVDLGDSSAFQVEMEFEDMNC